jgi:hypothetical protein
MSGAGRTDLDLQCVMYPVKLNVPLLCSVGNRNVDRVVSDRHDGHGERETRNENITVAARKRPVSIVHVGIVTEQGLTEAVVEEEPDDRRGDLSPDLRGHTQRHALATHGPRKRCALFIEQLDIDNTRISPAEGSGRRLETQYLDVVAVLRLIDRREPEVMPCLARRLDSKRTRGKPVSWPRQQRSPAPPRNTLQGRLRKPRQDPLRASRRPCRSIRRECKAF